MIEDFSKHVLSQPNSIYLMRLLPQLIHTGFISQKTKEKMLEGFDNLLNEHALRERQQLNEPIEEQQDTVLINTGKNPIDANEMIADKKFIASSDRDFIQTFCIDAIRLKKQDKGVSKAAIKAAQMADNNSSEDAAHA